MTTCFRSLARIASGTFLVLTSMFCLLAYVPYTYLFLVKEPPVQWLIFFIRYHSALYWFFFAISVYANWPIRKNRLAQAALLIQAILGTAFTASGYVPGIRNNIWALVSSLTVLLPVLCSAIASIFGEAEANQNDGNMARRSPEPGPLDPEDIAAKRPARTLKDFLSGRGFLAGHAVSKEEDSGFRFSNAVLAGVLIALVSTGGSFINGNLRTSVANGRTSRLELAAVVAITHAWLAIVAAFAANLLLLVLRKARLRSSARALAVNSMLCAAWVFACNGFLQDSLTFRGWSAWTYSALFAVTVTLLGYAALRPALNSSGRFWIFAIAISLAAPIVFTPENLKAADWNGVVTNVICFLFWVFATLSVYLARPALKTYPLASLLGVAVIAGALYWGALNTTFLWAKELGATDGAVSRSIESYAQENTSFSFARTLLAGRDQGESCGDLCQTLRQYTNIRHARAPFEVNLVDRIEPAKTRPPDIYMIVIDSARRDYVGAYNPRADFTPNLDDLARDGFAINHAYTQYAGTTLSEAALWTGVIPLHAHYMRPFERVNNLLKLLKAENYQITLSYDSILRQIVPDSPDLVKFDLERSWNHVALAGSFQQLESFMESAGRDRDRPIFFYTQPLNVHHFFGDKNVFDENATIAGGKPWRMREGFNNRIAWRMCQVDEALGDFVGFLKERGLYDNSIIIVTSDHGEATGELGRESHSTIIYPEVMQVPLIIHLPSAMRRQLVYDKTSISVLTDVTPTLYYLLGQGPLKNNRFYGRPLFTRTAEEMRQYPRDEIFLASDVRATYGLLTGDGRYMFTIYDSPLKSYLFDLVNDPNATSNILTDASRREYQQRMAQYLHDLAEYYQYKPSGESYSSHNDCSSLWC